MLLRQRSGECRHLAEKAELGCAGLPLALDLRQDALHEVEPTGRGRVVERTSQSR
jgi:hypothetical protein